MDILTGTMTELSVPHGNTEMSQAVRRYLGKQLNGAEPDNYGGGRHPTYEEDIVGIATAMKEQGYLDICTLGPEGSNMHIVATDLAVALGQRQSYRQQKLEHEHVGNEANVRHPAYTLVSSMAEILTVATSEQPLYGHVGILPIINTIGRMVQHETEVQEHPERYTNLAEIVKRRPRILGIADLAVEHCLLARPGIAVDDLEGREVHSHPQALSQCSDYLEEEGLVPKKTKSTSAAAKGLARGEINPDALAIATRLAGTIYGLDLVAEDIGDLRASENITVMAVIAEPDTQNSRLLRIIGREE